MKLKAPQTVSNVESWQDLQRFSDQYFTATTDLLNGNLTFVDNIDVSIVTFNFLAANTTYQVTHTLERIPTGYLVIKKAASTDVYDGVGTNTGSAIFLRSTVATQVTVMVF
jgi:hypothetical protein